ncbi:MAG: hypothetical protein ACRDS9_12095 [Pseudonocardiaceae bacterium]
MSIIRNLFRKPVDVEAARADQIRRWYRPAGSEEDVWEAHAALERLEEVTRRENATGNELEESDEWLLANACAAEALSYVSWIQEWRVREAVAAGVPVGDL